jgi:hypothetical protein
LIRKVAVCSRNPRRERSTSAGKATSEHPTIEFLFHESENVMAIGDVSSCILLQIDAGQSPPRIHSTDD